MSLLGLPFALAHLGGSGNASELTRIDNPLSVDPSITKPSGNPAADPSTMSKHQAPSKPFIELDELLHADYGLFVLTTTVVLARVAIHFTKRKTLELQDYFIYLAYILYVTLWTAYVKAAPILYKLNRLKNGEIAVYPTVVNDAGFVSRMIFVAQICFYTQLFAVKWSLLSLYRKLLAGLDRIYSHIWWGIFVFCIGVSSVQIRSFVDTQ